MISVRTWATLALAGTLLSARAFAADTYLPSCFKPFTPDTKVMQFPVKKPPYRIAMANGFVGNTWRIQMIKTLKAYADTPEMKSLIKELKIVSTGTDVAAQIGAIDNFINAGFDAILTIAVNPTAFRPVIKRAKDAGVVLIPFDNVLDTDEVIQVNEDQKEMGRIMGRWSRSRTRRTARSWKCAACRATRSIATAISDSARSSTSTRKPQVIEVVGNWDDGTAQKVVADAIAVQGRFVGMYVQGGSTGAVRALIDAKHPFIPVAGEAENGFRKLVAQHSKDGLKGASAGQSPALVAISLKAAIAALEGKKLPQYISVPIPYADYTNLKAGVNYYPDQSDNFFTPNDFPPCGVNFTAMQIMGKTEANQ